MDFTIEQFTHMTREDRIQALLQEARWALSRGLLAHNADGLQVTAVGEMCLNSFRWVEWRDSDQARQSGWYGDGLRLHWLAVALGSPEPVEAVDTYPSMSMHPLMYEPVVERLRAASGGSDRGRKTSSSARVEGL